MLLIACHFLQNKAHVFMFLLPIKACGHLVKLVCFDASAASSHL